MKFTDFAHINIVVDDIDEGIKYYEQLLEAKPIQIFREFSNIGFAKAAGFLEHPELVKLSIAFMEIPGTKLTLELMEYYEPVTTDAKHREDINKINGVRHVALEIQNIDEAFKYIKTCPDITLINPSEQYGPYKIDDITADEVQFFEADMEADAYIKKQLCQTISNTYYFYFIDKYGVQWEFEQGHDY
ncbi:bleomycin resistance protein [Ruminococcus sp. OF02-6]|nr:bleomycin resistance protein [Ruminococcus sp. OF02-6]